MGSLLTEEKLRFVIEVRSTSLVIGSQIVPQKLHKLLIAFIKLLIAFIPRVTLFPKLRRGRSERKKLDFLCIPGGLHKEMDLFP
jgi:hypothetical protein